MVGRTRRLIRSRYDRGVDTACPSWFYFPSRARPPEWAVQFVGAVEGRREAIDSATVDGLTSDAVLAALAPALVPLGYRVELGKRVVDRIRLPVLFGDGGRERVAYEVDAFQDDLGVVVEIEAGCGARGNAVYRDLIRRSAAPASSSGGAWPYRS